MAAQHCNYPTCWYWSSWARHASKLAVCSFTTPVSWSSSLIISSAASVIFESPITPVRKCSCQSKDHVFNNIAVACSCEIERYFRMHLLQSCIRSLWRTTVWQSDWLTKYKTSQWNIIYLCYYITGLTTFYALITTTTSLAVLKTWMK
jgi:hypothetical protein